MKEEKIKVSYDQIKKANEEIEKMQIKGGDYAKVNERTKAYRKVYPSGVIETEIQEITEDKIRIKAIIKDENDRVIATGHANETKEQKGNLQINLTSMIENCETSAVGRALGFAGFGIDKEIASSEDMQKVNILNRRYQIASNVFIPEFEAKNIVKLVIKDLARKTGLVLEELKDEVDKKLWCSIDECSVRQLINIESILKTVNNEKNEWHNLYANNIKIKDYVPKNQEIIYESSNYKFGKLALEKVGTDENLRSEIIDEYLNMGINLENKN